MSPDDPEQVLAAHRPLIDRHVARVLRRLRRRGIVDKDDLEQIASLALLDAHARFDARRGVPFAAFAARRIHHRITDELRRAGPLTKRQWRAAKGGASLYVQVPIDTFARALVADTPAPRDVIALARVAAALARLPHRERTAIRLVFGRGLVMKAAGRLMGVNESRVSQIVKAGVERLRGAVIRSPPCQARRSSATSPNE